MKTPICILPAAALALTLSACGDDGDSTSGNLTNLTPPAATDPAGETSNGEQG